MDLLTIFKMILSLSFMGSVLTGIIIITKVLFRSKFRANWHYYIWLILIIRLLVPFTPESPLSIFNLLPSALHNIELSQNISGSLDASITYSATRDRPAANRNADTNAGNIQNDNINIENMIAPKKNSFGFDYRMISIVWLIGAVLIILYMLIINSIFMIRTKKKICKDEEILRTFDECKSKMNVNTNIPIIYDKNLKTPSLFGLITPKLLINTEITYDLSKEERKYIFLHELAHLKRKDILINWIMIFVQALHWFNPIVWYAFFKAREDCEVACDAYVLSRLKPMEHKSYGETIINLANKISKNYWNPVTTGMANNTNSLKKRIKMIAMFKKDSWKWSIIALAMMIVVGFFGLTNAKKPVNVIGTIEKSTKSTQDDLIKTTIPKNDDINNIVTNEIYEKDKINGNWKETVVINDCSIRNGPGENYKDIGNLKYGDTVLLEGSYDGWFLAKSDKIDEFWINSKNIVDYDYNYDKWTFGVLTVEKVTLGQITLNKGNLICILKRDSDRSYVRPVAVDISSGYSGWIKNSEFSSNKNGIYYNQAFLKKGAMVYKEASEKSELYNEFNELSGRYIFINNIQDNGWIHISAWGGIDGWVRNTEIYLP